MAEETITKLYDVQIQGSDALKTLADLKLQSQELREQQKALGKVTEENAEEYFKLDSQIKAVNKEASAYQKQVTNSIKLQNQQEASLEKLRTQLSLDNAEFVKLGNTQKDMARKDELGKQIAATTEELKRQEEALGDHRRSVGDYGKAARELKTEITELTDQLMAMAAAGDTTSKEYQEMLQRVGELKTAVEGVNQSITNTSKGTESIQALTGAVGGVTAVYGLWTSASAVLGKQNEELEVTMKKMMTVVTALNSLTAISNALSKTNATYRAAEMLLQKVGITQTKAETKALAAKNTMMASGNVLTKAAAAATWLWNAALAANPVVLLTIALAALVAGLAALGGAFKGATKESKAAKVAMDEYRRSVEVTTEAVGELERQELKRSRENEIALRDEIEAIRERGGTAQEIADAEYTAAQRQRQFDIAYGKEKLNQYQQDYALAMAAIAAKEKELNNWTGSVEKLKEAQDEMKSLREEAGKLYDLIQTTSYNVRKTAQDAVSAARDHTEAVKKSSADAAAAAQDAADKALQAWMTAHQSAQQILEQAYKARNVFISNDIRAQQKYNRELLLIQQTGERERLKMQHDSGKITASEYANQLKLLTLIEQQFHDKQLLDLNDHYKKVRDDLLTQVGKSVDQQIGEVTAKYSKAMEDLASMQAPARVAGMSDAEYAEMLKEYEAFIYTRATLEEELARNLETEIQAIRDEALAEQMRKFDEALEKEYKGDLAKYTDNERKKLEVQAEMLRKQIAQRKSIGEETYELEAELRANALALAGMDYSRDTILAGNNAKAKYEARKKYLDAELEAAGNNTDRILEIQDQMRVATEEYWGVMVDQVQAYANEVGAIFDGITNILNNNSDAQLQKIKIQYSEEEQELARKYALNVLTEAQYNAETIKLQKQLEKEEARIEREKAKRERTGKVFSTIIDTAAGVAKAVSASPLTFGLPWSAFVAATGALQLATILSEPLPKAARGKFIRGKRHNAGGTIIEAEDGETVINRKSTSMFLPLLSAINEMGGGVPFTTVGSDGGYAIRSGIAGSAGITGSEMNAAIQDAFGNVTVVATIEDIRRADNEYANIESSGSF